MTAETLKEISSEIEKKSQRLQRANEMACEKLPIEELPTFIDALTNFTIRYVAEYYAGGPQ